MRPGADVTFICTAKSKVGGQGAVNGVGGGGDLLSRALSATLNPHPIPWPPLQSPAYTLVWTRLHNGKLPARAMDFNGILTIRNVQPSDAGTYVCTGSNMFAMDQGTATLHVQGIPFKSTPDPSTPVPTRACSTDSF